FIREGKVRVYKRYLGQKNTLAIVGEGDVFGELSFFDAKPRSASIEALTDVTVLAVDGKSATADLPHWVMPLLRTAFHRFREADQKITVLQSINEYQKRAFKKDAVAKTIYLELFRFIKTLKLLYKKDFAADGEVKSEQLKEELDDVLGNRFLGLKVFWRLLKEFDFIDSQTDETEGKVIMNAKALDAWNENLAAEIKSERYLMLSHTALALLRRIVGRFKSTDGIASLSSVVIRNKDIKLKSMPLHESAIKELQKHKLLSIVEDGFSVHPAEICPLFMYQSIVKSFDHTLVNLD
ncbi:MAG: cyclic nucleotide-binding domain-containing protein, partial [Bdellovibrionota bacterium]